MGIFKNRLVKKVDKYFKSLEVVTVATKKLIHDDYSPQANMLFSLDLEEGFYIYGKGAMIFLTIAGIRVPEKAREEIWNRVNNDYPEVMNCLEYYITEINHITDTEFVEDHQQNTRLVIDYLGKHICFLAEEEYRSMGIDYRFSSEFNIIIGKSIAALTDEILVEVSF